MITVHRRLDTLTDGSVGHDVVIRADGQDTIFRTYDERCADKLQQAIVDALNLYACEEVAMGDELRASAGWLTP